MDTRKFTAGFAVAGIILVIIAAGVLGYPSVYDVAGTAKLNGNPISPGTLIVAKDANGTEVGNFTATLSGFYGIMHLNGDDPNSTDQVISFFIDGVEADQTLIWQPFGYDPNFALTACGISTYQITVNTDSSLYYPGQDMAISGYLMNSQCSLEAGKAVAYSVPSTPIMGQLQTNGTGYFSVVVTIPSDMTLGEYTLWASYPPGSNDTVYDTTNFTVTNDKDNDGYDYPADCNDNDPSINPGAVDACGDDIDQDCSGSDASCGGGGGGGGVSMMCTTDWICTEGPCQPNGTQAVICTDFNSCNTTTGKPAETQPCNYTQPAPAGGACTEGTRICIGSDLMECNSGQWINTTTCEFGCSGNECNEESAEAAPGNETGPSGIVPVIGSFLLEPSAWPYWILIAFVIILVAWYLLGRRKKKQPKPAKQ